MKTAVILHALFSEFTYEQMEAIFSLTKEHNGKFRIVPTGIQIYDITKEQKESILEHLPDGVVQVQHKSVNSIVACRGTDGCSHAFVETIPMATMVDQKHYGKDMPNKIRIGISGCPRCCAESMIKDIGLVGKPNGFTLVAGGTSGALPRKAITLLEGLSPEEAEQKISELLEWYSTNAKPKEKFEHVLQRLGNPFQ